MKYTVEQHQFVLGGDDDDTPLNAPNWVKIVELDYFTGESNVPPKMNFKFSSNIPTDDKCSYTSYQHEVEPDKFRPEYCWHEQYELGMRAWDNPKHLNTAENRKAATPLRLVVSFLNVNKRSNFRVVPDPSTAPGAITDFKFATDAYQYEDDADLEAEIPGHGSKFQKVVLDSVTNTPVTIADTYDLRDTRFRAAVMPINPCRYGLLDPDPAWT